MIIKSKYLMLFEPDVIKVEYARSLEYEWHIVAYKNGQKFHMRGYESEAKALEQLNILNEAAKKEIAAVEI